MKRIVKIAALAAMVLALAGCKGRNRGPLLPNVSGKAGEIVVVIDKDNCSTWRTCPRAASTICSRCTGTSSS